MSTLYSHTLRNMYALLMSQRVDYLLFLRDWLAQFQSSRSGWTDDDTVLNVVEFLAESWTADLNLAGGNGWVGNIDQLLGNTVGVGQLGNWNISDSGDLGQNWSGSVTDLYKCHTYSLHSIFHY